MCRLGGLHGPAAGTMQLLHAAVSWRRGAAQRGAAAALTCPGVASTNISTFENWCTRYKPLPAMPAVQGHDPGRHACMAAGQ